MFVLGTLLFFAGTITIMGVMFAHGGVQKSKQFEVVGKVASGRAGRGARIAFFVGLASAIVGACSLFAGVAANDRARAKKCVATCRERGYADGKIRASTAVDPKKRTAFVACACERGGPPDPLELHADSL